jgi:hypothetical protein
MSEFASADLGGVRLNAQMMFCIVFAVVDTAFGVSIVGVAEGSVEGASGLGDRALMSVRQRGQEGPGTTRISKSQPGLSPRGWLLFRAESPGFSWLPSSRDTDALSITYSLVAGSSPRAVVVEITTVSRRWTISRSGGLEVRW